MEKEEEELQQLIEIYFDKQYKMLIDKQQKLLFGSLANKLKMSQEQ